MFSILKMDSEREQQNHSRYNIDNDSEHGKHPIDIRRVFLICAREWTFVAVFSELPAATADQFLTLCQ